MFDFSASWSSCSWVAWTRNLIAYSDMMTMAAIALTRCIYITCSQVKKKLLTLFLLFYISFLFLWVQSPWSTWLIAQPDDLCYCSLAFGVDHLVGGGNLI